MTHTISQSSAVYNNSPVGKVEFSSNNFAIALVKTPECKYGAFRYVLEEKHSATRTTVLDVQSGSLDYVISISRYKASDLSKEARKELNDMVREFKAHLKNNS